ncbi:MAG: Gfo/Idh/MocA family oxidoreductase [archaeon]|nr:Gfo/Idh/MocA family oxidoreductase [archaeon]
MTDIKKFKFALIGCGYWGNNIARVFSELKENGLFKGEIILYDKIYDKAKEFSKKYGFIAVKLLDDILTDSQIIAALIITPSSTHYNLTKQFLEAGKSVFVEKPFTLNSKKAMELVNLAKDKNKILMVGLIFRFHEGILELKRRIDLGEFGSILFLIGTKFGYHVPKEDSGVIFTLAVNDFDISCFLLDEKYPETILAQKGEYLQINLEDIVNISLVFPNNVQGYFMESWLVPLFDRHRELYIIGSKKTAKIDYLKPNEMVIYEAEIKKEELDERILFKMEKSNRQKVVFEFKEPLKEEMKHFIQCISEQKTPNSDGLVGYRAVKMCELAIKSANLGKRINMKQEIKNNKK